MAGSKMRPAFYRLHAATLSPDTTPERLADLLREAEAVQDRHRLAEGAVYASACRRYLLDTGRSWRAETVTDDTTTWGESAHRYRYRAGLAECSCGWSTVAPGGYDEGQEWHAAHAAGVAAPA